jgi:hypothetical protein
MSIEEMTVFLLGNFTLTFFVIGVIFSGLALAGAQTPLTGPLVAEALFKWFLFFSIGIAYIYNAGFHIFFHELAPRFIGWPDSPFQIELGFASLGMGVIGVIATWRRFDMRLAAILGPACFLWGAAGVHIHSMISEHNFEPGNAGVIFWTDILIPLIGFILLWLQHRYEIEGCSAAPHPAAPDRATSTLR